MILLKIKCFGISTIDFFKIRLSFPLCNGENISQQNVALLEEEEEINQLTEFFSYEHFYVIYCKFWELDTDHDLYIDQRDLMRHNDQGTHPPAAPLRLTLFWPAV